jgi:predicted transcriptional regulator
MSTTIVIDLNEETKAALEDAARDEGVSQVELIDKALQDYLFVRRFRSLRERMISKAGNAFTDQEVFDLIS